MVLRYNTDKRVAKFVTDFYYATNSAPKSLFEEYYDKIVSPVNFKLRANVFLINKTL